MRSLRNVLYALGIVVMVCIAFFPALFLLVLEEVAHKKGDEQ